MTDLNFAQMLGANLFNHFSGPNLKFSLVTGDAGLSNEGSVLSDEKEEGHDERDDD